ncbi:hypothetical protein PG994_015168 [Apiospora phragmitis]|uniref:Phosphoglycerate mutase-like protein n=1 Tax=Apiospora phragmitis TaxID=2905665 RepID=A0ABR1SVN4_9PEZI
MAIEKVNILFVRHAAANSAVNDEQNVGPETGPELYEILNGENTKVGNGDYFLDGLTKEGLGELERFCDRLKQFPIPDVAAVVCSTSTRSIQTALAIAQACQLSPSDVRPIDELREITPWPHDQSALYQEENGKRYIKYIMLRGGSREDAGEVVGVKEVDISGLDWPNVDQQTRTQNVMHPRTREALEATVTRGRQLVRDVAKGIQGSSATGNRTVIVVTHGGILNVLLDKYYCDMKNGKLVSSTTLKNLDAVNCSFSSADDPEARLQEKGWDQKWVGHLGLHYRNLIGDTKQPGQDGIDHEIDHEEAYWKFNQRAGAEVTGKDQGLIQILLI